MYNPYPTDNPNVIVKNTPKGRGVFATRNIPAGVLIAEFVGELIISDLATTVPADVVDHVIQVGPKEFISAKGRLAEIINHSCDPNCGIQNLTQVVTAYPVKAGDEITWDYRCSENSDWVLEQCLCGAERCTGRVNNYESLPDNFRAEYLQKGMISEWISEI